MQYTREEVEEMRRLMGITDEEPINPAPGIGDVTGEYVLLENIVCRDADGNVREQYPKLYVKKDIERNPDGSFLKVTPYKSAVHFQQQANGLFTPPIGLSCRIAVELYRERADAEIAKILHQYFDYSPQDKDGLGHGWHCHGTLINWARNVIISHPNDSDFPSNGGTSNINAGKRYEISFEREGLQTMSLEDVLKGNNASMKKFVRQFTMLEQPELLVEIGNQFPKKKTAKVWVPGANCKDMRAVWLGCGSNSFILDANDYLYGNDAVRGVSASP
ncbi:MAG: hypothetical protein QME12_07680 [Nanoarchaeota archaeon]|nr:hypothetical protein [Nanoarchaeota archaeon]